MNGEYNLKRTGLFLITALFLLLGGCAGLGPGTAAQRVTLANLMVQEMRGLETMFLVELRVLNPNQEPLQIRGIDCELKVDDRPFAQGLTGGSYDIPPYGSLTITVPVYASMFDMVSSVVNRLQQQAVPGGTIPPLRYEVTGHVRLAGGFGGSLPFASKGELALDSRPRPYPGIPLPCSSRASSISRSSSAGKGRPQAAAAWGSRLVGVIPGMVLVSSR